jgi:hypothetical protein
VAQVAACLGASQGVAVAVAAAAAVAVEIEGGSELLLLLRPVVVESHPVAPLVALVVLQMTARLAISKQYRRTYY